MSLNKITAATLVLLPLLCNTSYAVDYFSQQDSAPPTAGSDAGSANAGGAWIAAAALSDAADNSALNVALGSAAPKVQAVTQSTDTPAQFLARYQLTQIS